MNPTSLGKMLHLVCCLLGTFTIVDAFRGGAPVRTCHDMKPHHNEALPQNSSHFKITINPSNVQPGAAVTVRLESLDGTTFKGFFVQGRNAIDDTIVGTFDETDEIQAIACFEKPHSGATHKNNTIKNSLALTWRAPAEFQGNVKFKSTIVEEYARYWMDIEPPEPLKVAGTAVIQAPAMTPPTEEEQSSPFQWLYDGCYETKGCFGGPANCVEKRTCSHVVTYALNGTQFDVEMMSKANGWVGVGFSDDEFMGRDAVTVCAVNGSNSQISIFQTWNTESNYQNEVLADMTKSLSNLYSKHDDGFTYCRFKIESNLVINDKLAFNFLNSSYYLFLARGPMSSLKPPIQLGPHPQAPYKTSAAALLSDVSPIGMASNTLIKLHGCLMIIAWVGTVSLAIFLARFYKQTWTDVVHCKQKVWFTWHRLLNILTVLLTIAGLVVIFLQLQGWSQIWKVNYHPIIGIITAGLAVIQPIMAVFRCHPGTPKRPVFNILHFCVGNAAYVLAIVTLFYAKTLAKANLPDFYMWILIAFVVFHVVVFLIMESFSCFKGKTLRGNQIAMKDLSANGNAYHVSDQNAEAPGSRFRKFMLSVYTFGNVCFVMALVATVAVSPVKEL